MLVVHHMGVSQSERIVWLCEELGLDYKLVIHARDPIMSPESLKSLPGNESGKSPFLEDPEAGITLSESGAICEYIINKHGSGRLALPPSDKRYSEYLQWFHFTNATLQPMMVSSLFAGGAEPPSANPMKQFADYGLASALQLLDDRLKQNKWLAGDEFTAADIMIIYSLTSQRYFGPQVSFAPYPNILRYLQDCAARPAYQKAMEKGDPEMRPLLDAEPPSQTMIAAGGVTSSFWKKSYNNG